MIPKCGFVHPLLKSFIWLFSFIAKAEGAESGRNKRRAKCHEAASRLEVVKVRFAMLCPALLVVVKLRT